MKGGGGVNSVSRSQSLLLLKYLLICLCGILVVAPGILVQEVGSVPHQGSAGPAHWEPGMLALGPVEKSQPPV